MSAEQVILGPDACCDVNFTPFGLVSLSFEVLAKNLPRTATDDTSKVARQDPYRQLKATLTAQRQADVSYHVGPTNFTSRQAVSLKLWLNGRQDAAHVIDVPEFLIERFSGGGAVQGSQPQTVQISGESSGDFTLPGE